MSRPCERCGGPKGPGQGRRLCDGCRPHAPTERLCRRCQRLRRIPKQIGANGIPTCRDCAREARRERTRRWMAQPGVLERRREASRAWKLAHPEYSRANWRRVVADPVRHERLNESRRMAMRLRRELEGRPIPPVPVERYHGGDLHRVQAAPVIALIDAWTAETGLPLKVIAKQLGSDDREIRRMRRQQMVNLATADRIATALNSHIDLLVAS